MISSINEVGYVGLLLVFLSAVAGIVNMFVHNDQRVSLPEKAALIRPSVVQ